MFIPYLISERELGGWEDCVWCTGVMIANGFAGRDVRPATRAEYEALRVAGGDGPAENPGDGSMLSQLRLGLEARYGITDVVLGNGFPALLSAAPIGSYIALNGYTGALPERLVNVGCRNIAHTFLACRDSSLSMLVLDPCRANGSPPMRAANDELRRYHEALPGAAWLAGRPLPPPEVDTVLRFRITEDVSGTVECSIDGAALVTLDGRRVPIPAGQIRQCVAGVELLEPLDNAPGDRSNAWLVGLAVGFESENVEVALLLKSAATPHLVRIEALP